MEFDGPDDLNRYVSEVREDLEAAGLAGASDRLGLIQGSAFTTGSEWLGELGTAVNEIRRRWTLPRDLDAKLERIMREVRHGWPSL